MEMRCKMTPTNKPSPECVRAAEEIIEVLPNIIPVGIEAEKLCDTLAHIIARETRVNEMREALEDILRYCVTPTGCPDRDKGRTDEQQKALDRARAALGEGGGK
jgi:hypothetical protein